MTPRKRSADRRLALLTPAELRALAAMRTADSEKAAAHELGIAVSTLKGQLMNARSKLGVPTTRQAVIQTLGIEQTAG